MKLVTSTLAAVLATTAFAATAAHADGISSVLSATYYQVLDAAGDPDFNSGTFPVVANGSALGPDGLPVGAGVYDLNGASEITWWSPAFNSNVTQTGTGTITLPYSGNMYPPNSTGGDDSTAFETAKFSGLFTLDGSGTVTFTLGSDDDTFLYVDGSLIGQNPGVHGVTTVVFTSPTLAAGAHSIDLFYADRENTGAYLSLDSSASITPGVPEPATWAMMLIGLGGVGAVARRRTRALTA